MNWVVAFYEAMLKLQEAVTDISPAVLEKLKNQAKMQEVRKVA